MTTEEKARAYDEAYKTAEKIHNFSSDPAEIKRIEQIFPEIKESKDEEIRKEIIEQINLLKSATLSDLRVNQFNSWIDWLEKQVEQKPADNVESTTQSYITPDQKFFQWIYDRLIYVHNENPNVDYMLSLKERIKDMQKPAWSEEPLSDIENRIINFAMQFHDNRMKPESEWEDEVKMLRDNISSFSKIDTWSEEDEKILDGVITNYESGYLPSVEKRDEIIEKLKSLKDRVLPQSKQEWSEQEQVRINRIVACLENLKVADNDILLKDVEWLKSLRPQPQSKWSKDDESFLYTTIAYLKDAKEFKKTAENCINWLLSIKERYTWKPNNEQMLAVNTAINVIGKGTLNGKQLIELQEQLMKLK